MLCVEPRCPEDASLGSHLSIADSSGPETGPLLCIQNVVRKNVLRVEAKMFCVSRQKMLCVSTRRQTGILLAIGVNVTNIVKYK